MKMVFNLFVIEGCMDVGHSNNIFAFCYVQFDKIPKSPFVPGVCMIRITYSLF